MRVPGCRGIFQYIRPVLAYEANTTLGAEPQQKNDLVFYFFCSAFSGPFPQPFENVPSHWLDLFGHLTGLPMAKATRNLMAKKVKCFM